VGSGVDCYDCVGERWGREVFDLVGEPAGGDLAAVEEDDGEFGVGVGMWFLGEGWSVDSVPEGDVVYVGCAGEARAWREAGRRWEGLVEGGVGVG